MVEGCVAEFGSPTELMERRESLFSELVRGSRIVRANSKGVLPQISTES
jgi:hypothetical protein